MTNLSNIYDVPADTKQVAKHFSYSAKTYRSGAQLQYKVGERLLSMREAARSDLTLDLGCGPGLFSQELRELSEQLLSLDMSSRMLAQNQSAEKLVQADSHALPFLDESFDFVYSSLMVQWCDLTRVLQEVQRVLKPGGQLLMSTLVTGSLNELQSSWQAVDNDQHIHDYLNFEQVEKTLDAASWKKGACSLEKEVFWFDNAKCLAKELKALGANYVENRKSKGLVTRAKWQKMENAYRNRYFDSEHQAIPATYYVTYINLIK